jgi:transcriptional regulator with XRE-family HTH domain
MAWARGVRRNVLDVHSMIAVLVAEFGGREIARRCCVSDRTVRRWASGEDWPRAEALHRLIDSLYPQSRGALPIYEPTMAIDGNTRMGGVGEYSRRAARGDMEYLRSTQCSDLGCGS